MSVKSRFPGRPAILETVRTYDSEAESVGNSLKIGVFFPTAPLPSPAVQQEKCGAVTMICRRFRRIYNNRIVAMKIRWFNNVDSSFAWCGNTQEQSRHSDNTSKNLIHVLPIYKDCCHFQNSLHWTNVIPKSETSKLIFKQSLGRSLHRIQKEKTI